MKKSPERVIFEVGEIVRCEDGRRGVIIDLEISPGAEGGKKTPGGWCYLLLDGGESARVPQEDLVRDREKKPVSHPLTKRVFAAYHDGRYYREGVN